MANLTMQLSTIARSLHPRFASSVLCRSVPKFLQTPRVITLSYSRREQFSTINGPICDIQSASQRQIHLTNLIQRRFRKRKGRGSKNDDGEEEDDDDDEAFANENPLLVDDLLNSVNDGSMNLNIDVHSLRLDVVCKTGFGLSRTKVEEVFYAGDIYINGERAKKKSQDLSLNDEIDIIRKPDQDDPNLVHISRLVITELPDKANERGRLKLKIRRWQDLTVEAPSQRGRD